MSGRRTGMRRPYLLMGFDQSTPETRHGRWKGPVGRRPMLVSGQSEGSRQPVRGQRRWARYTRGWSPIGGVYRAGLRISEALALERRDVNPKTGTLTVRHGKGDRHRTVGMDPEGFALPRALARRAAPARPGTDEYRVLHPGRAPSAGQLRPPAPPPPGPQSGH